MTIWGEGGIEVRLASTRWALLRLALVGSAVCNLAHIACLEVEHHDPAHALADPLAIEGYVLLIRVEPAAKDDLTVPGRASALALVVVVFLIVSATGQRRQSHGHHH